jgi:competence protein ComEA
MKIIKALLGLYCSALLHSFYILKIKVKAKEIDMKGCMSKIKKEITSNFKLFKATCFFMLLLGSYNGLAQTHSENQDDLNVLQSGPTEQVNINLADAETIAMVLDGVGLNRAEAIVDYRESNGDFKAIDDLIMVSGIGEFTVRNNADKILLFSE